MSNIDEELLGRIKARLLREMGGFKHYLLEDSAVTNIMLNPDGALWVQRSGSHAVCEGKISATKALSFLSTVASTLNTVLTAESPSIDGILIVDGSRISGQIPPIVSAPSFSIRKHSYENRRLSWFVDNGTMTHAQHDILIKAISEKKNIVVVGSTNSGKTYLVKSFLYELSHLSPDDRVLTIEEVGELVVPSRNYTSWYTSPGRTMLDLLHLSLRANPDRVMVGEVRGGEAYQMLKLWRTGHPGGFTTCHGDKGVLDGLKRMEMMAAESKEGGRLGPEWIKTIIADAIDFVVTISLVKGGSRIINQIVTVGEWKNGEYEIHKI